MRSFTLPSVSAQNRKGYHIPHELPDINSVSNRSFTVTVYTPMPEGRNYPTGPRLPCKQLRLTSRTCVHDKRIKLGSGKLSLSPNSPSRFLELFD